MRSTALATLAYFGLVFGAGFLLGIIRVLVMVPHLGEKASELAEIPVMLAVIYLSADSILRRFRPANLLRCWAVGICALLLLLILELTIVLQLRGLTFAEYIDGRDPLAGFAYALGLLVFAAMPALLYMYEPDHRSD